jgi:integrase/recombinase XerD
MTRRRFPIASLPEAAWPAADRAAWAAARAPGGFLGDAGLAAHWAGVTAARTMEAYGVWAGWLAAAGELDPAAPPAARITPERLARYVAALAGYLAPVSVERRITLLGEAVRVMCPDEDTSWLRRVAGRLKARALPSRDKASRLVAAHELVEAGLGLMAQATIDAEATAGGAALQQAADFRDGLMIAFLALRPVRVKNLVELTLGGNLILGEDTAEVRFAAAAVKNRRPLAFSWPDMLIGPLQIYLAVHRPILLQGGNDDALWISQGRRLGYQGCQQRVQKTTLRLLGKSIPPH